MDGGTGKLGLKAPRRSQAKNSPAASHVHIYECDSGDGRRPEKGGVKEKIRGLA
jgi:hypothetical protein